MRWSLARYLIFFFLAHLFAFHHSWLQTIHLGQRDLLSVDLQFQSLKSINQSVHQSSYQSDSLPIFVLPETQVSCYSEVNFSMVLLQLSHVMRKPFMQYVNNKGVAQPAYPCSLISTFVVHCLDSLIPIFAKSSLSRL